MWFTKKEVQLEIDKIQVEEKMPDFMLVACPSDYTISEDGYFRNVEEDTAFFIPESKNHKERLTELAKAIIEQSL